MRAFVASALSTILMAATPLAGSPARAAGGAAPPTYRANDFGGGQIMSILPPGENGLVNAAEFAQYQANGTRPPASQDQLGPYANLMYAPGLTNSQLPN